ncbi:CoA pyrophosphatase [Pyruvatibacter sp.]|uniref:CoA pyrophosphatase n=1 Tax=Pyruvatibacter sp. TaxID=1981328 RepID=UPI0032F00C26
MPSSDFRAKLTAGLRASAPVLSETDASLNGDFRLNDRDDIDESKAIKEAAVLVPLIERPDGIHVLLTERAGDLSSHAGQVAFPGGRIDPEDADAVDAALREAEEEVGLDRSFVEVAGFLDPYETGTRFRVVPVVGFVTPGFTLTLNPAEVDEVFEVPLAFLMNPDNHERHSARWQGKKRTFFAMPYDGHYIWGATAGMIVNLYERSFAPASV